MRRPAIYLQGPSTGPDTAGPLTSIMKNIPARLSEGELHELKRWNTPTVYNGWEQITRHDAARDAFNLEPTRDYMPHMGPMAGYAVTVTCQPGNVKHKQKNPNDSNAQAPSGRK